MNFYFITGYVKIELNEPQNWIWCIVINIECLLIMNNNLKHTLVMLIKYLKKPYL